MTPAKSRKKLIEVALPLDAINRAAAREKSIRRDSAKLAARLRGQCRAPAG